jgi:5-(carboxyamino)imidazole ribonucleotide synthase
VLAVPGAHLHVYGKEPRPGRKLGHVTLRAESTDVLRRRLVDLAASTGVVLPGAVAAWTRSSSCA